MGREYPAPRPYIEYLYILYFQKRTEKKEPKKSEKKTLEKKGQPTPPQAIMIHNHDSRSSWSKLKNLKIFRPENMSREIWNYLVQRLCPEKYENISSRDYVFHTTFDGQTDTQMRVISFLPPEVAETNNMNTDDIHACIFFRPGIWAGNIHGFCEFCIKELMHYTLSFYK